MSQNRDNDRQDLHYPHPDLAPPDLSFEKNNRPFTFKFIFPDYPLLTEMSTPLNVDSNTVPCGTNSPDLHAFAMNTIG